MAATTCTLLFLITGLNVFVDATTTTTTDRPRYTLRLPATAKYYPKDIDELVRQYERYDSQDVVRRPNKPVMKLLAHVNADEGEKYYDFDSFISYSGKYPMGNEERLQPGRLYLPVNPHASHHEDRDDKDWTIWFKYPPALRKRQVRTDATCPPGNSPCTNIQKPGYCCPGGTSCVSIQDTGFGSVGCCPNNEPCGDSLDTCAPGYSKCPSGSGGGCCLPGYICSPQGCLINTSNIPPPTTVSWVSTTTIGLDICQTGYYPCPASLNYGCCQVGYHCALHACPYNTGTGTPGTEYIAPTFVIGTTGSVIINPGTTDFGPGFSTIDIATVTAATITGNNTQDAPKITNAPGNILSLNNCPNGWLTCSAEFGGGCCRFGRDCGVGYCPVPTDDGSNGSTGVVTVTTNNGCPAGWLQCPAEVQGGCCPSGYGCGVYNCPATTTLQDGVPVIITTAAAAQKLSPVGRNDGTRTSGEIWALNLIIGWVLGYTILVGMI
ncbi:hypothetical protein EYR41_009113 [Orbilia oligospora]|uniref:Uncharacterized protein n=1 Tax=Orbilia oligospora TaxID=2813651 RepID=A0A7C8K3H3_ORBOL|nr:hypothetical protein TWF751_000545 [Orbilia oligospora]TGJ65116.1 hypothetical protein EYR41_009113 [Orbilia oligospora]